MDAEDHNAVFEVFIEKTISKSVYNETLMKKRSLNPMMVPKENKHNRKVLVPIRRRFVPAITVIFKMRFVQFLQSNS